MILVFAPRDGYLSAIFFSRIERSVYSAPSLFGPLEHIIVPALKLASLSILGN